MSINEHVEMNISNYPTQMEPMVRIESYYKVAMEVNERSCAYGYLEVTSSMMWKSTVMPCVILRCR